MTGRTVIAIAAQDDRGLDGEVSAHFGRCPFYVMVEVSHGKRGPVRVIRNPYFGAHQPGVMPSFLQQQGANVILAGGMGLRAIQMFQGRGIEVATGAVGTIEAALRAYLQGKLQGIAPCAHDHPESGGKHGAEETSFQG